MENLVPIGLFSKVCRLTVKALRHYDELGLLRPAAVDPDSGYRYYSLSQAVEAERIRLLRSVDMPLDEIREFLRERDPESARTHLERHRRRIEERLAADRQTLDFLHRLMSLQEGIAMAYEVRVKEVTSQPMVNVRTRTPLSEISQVMRQAFQEMFAYLGEMGVRAAGPTSAVYHDPEFKEEDVDVEICVPVEQAVPGRGRVSGGQLPAGPVVYTLHAGPYNEIGPAYHTLIGWIREHGHETAGPPREVYLVAPDRARDPSDYRTEVQWPIR